MPKIIQTKIVAIQSYAAPITLGEDEILHRIPYEDLMMIKEHDPHPYFRAYSIAQEGEYSPKIVDEGYKKITWTKKAIQSLKNIVIKGIKFFKGHNADNSTNNREDFGEVVANFEKVIGDKTHHIVIGYFPDKSKVVDNDIVSMEADWTFLDNAGQWIAEKIEQITGIALGDSKKEQPAFSGARVLGEVQALGEGEKEMTFAEVRQFVIDHNVYPWQLFSIETMKADREFGKLLVEAEAKEKKYKDDMAVLETRAKTAEEKAKTLESNFNKQTAKSRLDAQLKANNIQLTEKEKAFMDIQFKSLQDLSDDSLKMFITTSRELYKEAAAVFGEKAETTKVDTSGDNKKDDEKNEFIIDD